MNKTRLQKIDKFMRFYKGEKIPYNNIYGYHKIDDYKVITNGYSLIFLKDLDDNFNEMKKDMKTIIQEKYNKIINELENSTELKYNDLGEYVFRNDELDSNMIFDLTLVNRILGIIGKKCRFYVLDEEETLAKKTLVVKNDKGEIAYILPMKI